MLILLRLPGDTLPGRIQSGCIHRPCWSSLLFNVKVTFLCAAAGLCQSRFTLPSTLWLAAVHSIVHSCVGGNSFMLLQEYPCTRLSYFFCVCASGGCTRVASVPRPAHLAQALQGAKTARDEANPAWQPPAESLYLREKSCLLTPGLERNVASWSARSGCTSQCL